MKQTIENRIVELRYGDILVKADYSENAATIGCNGNYLYITVDQLNELLGLMAAHSSYSMISGAKVVD